MSHTPTEPEQVSHSIGTAPADPGSASVGAGDLTDDALRVLTWHYAWTFGLAIAFSLLFFSLPYGGSVLTAIRTIGGLSCAIWAAHQWIRLNTLLLESQARTKESRETHE